MGVAGCGEPTVGAAVLDGEDLHAAWNIAEMARGEPLSDADRHAPLERVGAALRRGDRDRLRAMARGPVVFVYREGRRELAAGRMAARVPASSARAGVAAAPPPPSTSPV